MLKRKGDIMSVFRVKKNNNYTVMANYHLRDKELSFKAKGLLSYMLSLPEDWDYSLNGLASVSKEGIKAIKNIISELKEYGYLKINKIRKENGQYQYEYLIREIPEKIEPEYQKGYSVKGKSERGIQINTNKQNTKGQIDKEDKSKKSSFFNGLNSLTKALVKYGYTNEDDVELLNYNKLFNKLKKILKEKYNLGFNDYERKSIINVLTNNFASGSSKNTYKECVFIEEKENDYSISNDFKRMLQNNDFRNILSELIEFGISRYNKYYSEKYQDTQFVIYQKYTYEDVCRLLNWKNNEVPLNIGGYKYDKDTKTFPVFINYDKNEEINDTIKYEDHFENSNRLIAISKSGRTILSEDVQNFINAKERGIKVELFVRKNKDDKISKEFYYLGRMNATGNVKEFVMPNTNKTAVEIEWILETPVREDIYEYIINC